MPGWLSALYCAQGISSVEAIILKCSAMHLLGKFTCPAPAERTFSHLLSLVHPILCLSPKEVQHTYWVMQANDPAWHQLKLNHTLRLALAQKDVVEFPIITVALPEELSSFNVLGLSNKNADKQAASL